MTRLTRRHALGTLTLAPLPALAAVPDGAPQPMASRRAIEAYARAWEAGDMTALLNCYHPDFTLNYFGRNALAGRHVGKVACIQVLGEMRRRTGRRLRAITSLMAGEGQAAMVTRESVGRGVEIEVERLYVYAVSGEQLHECWVYDQDQRLIDELIGA